MEDSRQLISTGHRTHLSQRCTKLRTRQSTLIESFFCENLVLSYFSQVSNMIFFYATIAISLLADKGRKSDFHFQNLYKFGYMLNMNLCIGNCQFSLSFQEDGYINSKSVDVFAKLKGTLDQDSQTFSVCVWVKIHYVVCELCTLFNHLL